MWVYIRGNIDFLKMSLRTIFWSFVLGLISIAEAGPIGDQCDWNGSGLSRSAERGVTPVYLRCREGAVSWLYPRGALRLLFRPPLPAEDKDFRVCIRVIRRPDPPDLFHTMQLNDTVAERFPARIFVEGIRKLIPLYAPDDNDPRELRCFRSKHGRAALYVEAEPEEGPKRRVATFKYEARPLEKRHYDPATAECRPCSESELELAFCTSDLVSRAVIVGSEQREDLDTTQLTLRLTKLIRATGANGESNDVATDDEYYRYATGGGGGAGGAAHAHVHVAAACGAGAGAGRFLVMARRALGHYRLVCAPDLGTWAELVRRRNEEGTAHCLLSY